MTAALVLGLMCAGCSSGWPIPGRGGMAETKWPPAAPDIPRPPAGLHDHLTCTLRHLGTLREFSIRAAQYTGEVGLLALPASRAQREYAGTFYPDSARTLAALDRDIDHLRIDMALPPFDPPECG